MLLQSGSQVSPCMGRVGMMQEGVLRFVPRGSCAVPKSSPPPQWLARALPGRPPAHASSSRNQTPPRLHRVGRQGAVLQVILPFLRLDRSFLCGNRQFEYRRRAIAGAAPPSRLGREAGQPAPRTMPPKKKDKNAGGEQTLTRIAIVSSDKCVEQLLARRAPRALTAPCPDWLTRHPLPAPPPADASPRSVARSARRAVPWSKSVRCDGVRERDVMQHLAVPALARDLDAAGPWVRLPCRQALH